MLVVFYLNVLLFFLKCTISKLYLKVKYQILVLVFKYSNILQDSNNTSNTT